VFRKNGNNKNLKAIREQLDSGTEVEMEALPVVLLVGLLKVKNNPSVHCFVLSFSKSVNLSVQLEQADKGRSSSMTFN
jgi:hypothetical protein